MKFANTLFITVTVVAAVGQASPSSSPSSLDRDLLMDSSRSPSSPASPSSLELSDRKIIRRSAPRRLQERSWAQLANMFSRPAGDVAEAGGKSVFAAGKGVAAEAAEGATKSAAAASGGKAATDAAEGGVANLAKSPSLIKDTAAVPQLGKSQSLPKSSAPPAPGVVPDAPLPNAVPADAAKAVPNVPHNAVPDAVPNAGPNAGRPAVIPDTPPVDASKLADAAADGAPEAKKGLSTAAKFGIAGATGLGIGSVGAATF